MRQRTAVRANLPPYRLPPWWYLQYLSTKIRVCVRNNKFSLKIIKHPSKIKQQSNRFTQALNIRQLMRRKVASTLQTSKIATQWLSKPNIHTIHIQNNTHKIKHVLRRLIEGNGIRQYTQEIENKCHRSVAFVGGG